jgi:single-strand DNA-binding protein
MNNVSLIGRLTSDPELRSTPSGTSVGQLRLAIGRPKRDGEDRGADYVDITVWNAQAETCAQYLSKGRQVAVTGRLEHSEWEDGDGNRRQKLIVVARTVDFLDRPCSSEEDSEKEPVTAGVGASQEAPAI